MSKRRDTVRPSPYYGVLRGPIREPDNIVDLSFKCFDILWRELSKKLPPPDQGGKQQEQEPIELDIKHKQCTNPMFITWKLLWMENNQRYEQLRGCIGTHQQTHWEKDVPEYVLKSSLHDSRFKPITLQEVQSLSCKFSLLRAYESITDPFNWEIGKHGIIIDFEYNGRRYSSTYLPEIAFENGLTKEETLDGLIKKAGCNEDLNIILPLLEVTRYQSSTQENIYNEWYQLRHSEGYF